MREHLNAAPGTRGKKNPTLKGSHRNVEVRPFQGRNVSSCCSGGDACVVRLRLTTTACPRLFPVSPSGIFTTSTSTHAFRFHAARGEDFFGGAEAVVEGFFEEWDAGEVCVCEVDWAEGLLGFESRAAPLEADARAYHGVAPAHHVEASGERTHVRVRAREVCERDLGPLVPARRKQSRARGARVCVGQRVVVSEDGRAAVESAL